MGWSLVMSFQLLTMDFWENIYNKVDTINMVVGVWTERVAKHLAWKGVEVRYCPAKETKLRHRRKIQSISFSSINIMQMKWKHQYFETLLFCFLGTPVFCGLVISHLTSLRCFLNAQLRNIEFIPVVCIRLLSHSFFQILASSGVWCVFYFLGAIFFCSFYLLNLVLAVVALSYELEIKSVHKVVINITVAVLYFLTPSKHLLLNSIDYLCNLYVSPSTAF